MPTYEYRCPSGHVFERFFQKISDERHAPCPTCGQRAERLISGGAGLVFKGSGFYATDYKRTEGKQEKPEGETGETKGETKPSEGAAGKEKDSSSSDT